MIAAHGEAHRTTKGVAAEHGHRNVAAADGSGGDGSRLMGNGGWRYAEDGGRTTTGTRLGCEEGSVQPHCHCRKGVDNWACLHTRAAAVAHRTMTNLCRNGRLLLIPEVPMVTLDDDWQSHLAWMVALPLQMLQKLRSSCCCCCSWCCWWWWWSCWFPQWLQLRHCRGQQQFQRSKFWCH